MSRRAEKDFKAVNIALQGGGAHGAFTWGVLDRIFEDDRLWIEAVSGTSAGAMNAVVAAQGMYEGGAQGARRQLEAFWFKVSEAGRSSPIQRSPLAVMTGDWSLKSSFGYVAMDLASRVASPYDTNPFNLNPLRKLVEEFVDFAKVRACTDMGVFLCATNVETGRGRVFMRDEMSLDVVMASACLPQLYQAVEIDGVPYWDGGYSGNPPLMSCFDTSPSNDIILVQINPVRRPGAPRKAQDILNRVNEITFNSALLQELRTIDLVNGMIDRGELTHPKYRRMKVHVVEARRQLRALDASSKLNTEWGFLRHLFEIGRKTAGRWLDRNYEHVGHRSTIDLHEMCEGVGQPPRHV